MKTEKCETREEAALDTCRRHRTGNRSLTHSRPSIPLIALPTRNMAARAYWRGLHAAEMAAWELSGGDFLLSHRAPRG
jgi:hypothetical protein